MWTSYFFLYFFGAFLNTWYMSCAGKAPAQRPPLLALQGEVEDVPVVQERAPPPPPLPSAARSQSVLASGPESTPVIDLVVHRFIEL
jgi:hypothetical protein